MTMFLAVVASWLNRDQLNVIRYLLAENEILKEQLDKKNIKLDLNNTQRRKLAKAGKKLGRKGLKVREIRIGFAGPSSSTCHA